MTLYLLFLRKNALNRNFFTNTLSQPILILLKRYNHINIVSENRAYVYRILE